MTTLTPSDPGVVTQRISSHLPMNLIASPNASHRIPIHLIASRGLGSQGHLYKKGRRVPSWKRRYFCLCDGELFYYYAAEMSNPFQPLGVISIRCVECL